MKNSRFKFLGLLAAHITVSSLLAQNTSQIPPDIISSTNDTNSATRMPEVVVEGRSDSLIGIASSATEGTVGAAQLQDRPILRSGEILETVPGVIITQHAGGGKANQYFLRGFNLDHGTDFATFLDGMPLNLPSHAHGQGYADMNIVIPEFVQRVNYEKGPYYADVGDFASAGAAHLDFYKTLPQNFFTAEVGMYGFERGVFGFSEPVKSGKILFGGEAYHDDGPWKKPDDYQKFNGLVTYSQGDDANGFSLTAHAYHGEWNSSDQTAKSAITDHLISTFDSLDDSTGGNSQRYSLQAEWHRSDIHSSTTVMAYVFYYDLDLFSDFTYFLTDTNRGDQFEQSDKRWVAGINAAHTIFSQWGSRDVQTTFGLQLRNDWINNGLFQTEDRQRADKTDADGHVLPAKTRSDRLSDTEAAFYFESKIQWAEKFRTVIGLRGDLAYVDDTSSDPNNSGTAADFLPSPKLSLIFGPWNKTEVYLQGGFGFHSNDGRGASQTEEPINADNPGPIPATAKKAPLLVQTKGAEIGVRTLAVPHLQSTLSFWYLYSDSELLFEGDTGNTVDSKQPSNRYGLEFANYYTPTKWLTFDADFARSWAYFTHPDEDGGTHVPEAIDTVISAGVTLHDLHGFTASLRLRYFGPRDLISDGSAKSDETILLNASVGYQFNKTWSAAMEILNLLDRRDHDIDYYYESRIAPGASANTEDHFHPVEPIQVRFALTARF